MPPLLDLGCGDGEFAAMLPEIPWTVGVDTWREGLRQAARRGIYRSLVLASGCRLPFRDDSFASAVSNCVLEHIPDVESAVGDVGRVLRPGGTFVFSVPSDRFPVLLLGSTLFRGIGLAGMAERYARWFNGHSRHFHTDTPEVWLQRLGRAGLVADRWQRYMSPGAVRALDAGHYFGAPNLVYRKVLGRWNVCRARANFWLTERLLRRYADEPAPNDGGYLFFVCHKP